MALALSITRDRTSQFLLTITQQGAALDISGKTIIFTLKMNRTDPDFILQKQSGSGISVVGTPASGVALMTIDPADTADLPDQTIYGMDCDLVLVDGSHVYSLDSGKMDVIGNITDV